MKRFLILLFILSLLFLQLGCVSISDVETHKYIVKNTNYSYESEGRLAIDSYHPYDVAYLSTLREKYKLDDLIASSQTDFEKVQAIVMWVTNLWPHDGWNEPERSDPLSILDEVTENGQSFRCVEYSTVIQGCLSAFDIPARVLGVKTADVETRELGAGHVVCEVYLHDLDKWFFLDGQWGVIPTLDDIPLNGVEFAQILDEYLTVGEDFDRDLSLINLQSPYDISEYFDWVHEYLFYFDFGYWQQYNHIFLSRSIYRSVMLTPINSKTPTVFQIHDPLDINIYTNSVVDFSPYV